MRCLCLDTMADESGSSTTLLRVGMTCGGCEGSVKRILGECLV